MPNKDTPPRLVEAWLEFHRQRLCRDLDAVFAFDRQGMEIWCRSEANRAYRRLQRIIEPLRDSNDVELYLTRPTINNEDNRRPWADIPPSLAENSELRSYLRPPAGLRNNPPRIITVVDENGQTYTYALPGPPAVVNAAEMDRIMWSRLIAWVNSVLRNSWIMRQYAVDIPELIHAAFEPAFGELLRRRARDVCRRHAKDMARSIRDLNRDLARAFPRPAKPVRTKSEAKKEPAALPAVMEMADGIATEARILSGRIYRFIHPVQHTVDLKELQRPGLLVSLDVLGSTAGDFEQALAGLPTS